MLRIFKNFRKQEVVLALFSVVFVVAQVWLELKLPDYMREITSLITTTEKATTEKTTTEKATTEASTTEKADTSTQTTVTISSGMSSEAIASALANAGLVDDASKFNSFLVANGYDMKLETGNFSLETCMSYEEIAKILTTKQ